MSEGEASGRGREMSFPERHVSRRECPTQSRIKQERPTVDHDICQHGALSGPMEAGLLEWALQSPRWGDWRESSLLGLERKYEQSCIENIVWFLKARAPERKNGRLQAPDQRFWFCKSGSQGSPRDLILTRTREEDIASFPGEWSPKWRSRSFLRA